MALDYRTKYMDLRAKMLSSTDTAYRLGYEKGMKDGTQAAQMQAMAQQQQQQAAMMGGQPGQPGMDPSQDPSMQGGMPQEAGGMPEDGSQDPMMGGAAEGAPEEDGGEEAGGSELDQHINELQGLVQKGEKPSVLDIRKAVTALAGIRKNQKNIWAKKTEKIIPAQKKVVDDILKKWASESKKPSDGLEAIIMEHGLKVDE